MRKDIEYQVDLKTVNKIINMASNNSIDFFEIEGVLNDDYLIYNDYRIRFGKGVKARKYILIESRFVNSWSNDLFVIQTDDDKRAENFMIRWEDEMNRLEHEEV